MPLLTNERLAEIQGRSHTWHILDNHGGEWAECPKNVCADVRDLLTALTEAQSDSDELLATANLWKNQRNTLQQRVEALEKALSETIGLAAGLDDDDPWFGRRRGAKEVLERAEAALRGVADVPPRNTVRRGMG